MTQFSDSIPEPIPISLIAGRYLLFDINVVTYLRRAHNICGVLIGSIPQVPQQNVFLGLPLELLPEEARLLVEKEVAYIVDDLAWHKHRLTTLEGEDRKKYLGSLRSEGLKARSVAEGEAKRKSERALAKHAAARAMKKSAAGRIAEDHSIESEDPSVVENDSGGALLFDGERPLSPTSSTTSTSTKPYAITPTTSYTPSSLPQNPLQQSNPPVPSSYALFKHLHCRDYFIMPGLRFGCDYNVYPGDPLRFHSHFLAVGYDWNEEIPLLDLIGGGRLGTGVKKAFLIGGENPDSKPEEGQDVRTFCIEWGGM
jgi:tRNA-splicing endonuclease subunit Sen34